MEKLESSYIPAGSVIGYNPSETVWHFLKMLNIDLSYDLETLLLGIH